VGQRDYVEWHRPYDDPGSGLSQRLALVQAHLRSALDDRAPGAIRLISMCAGQGRDVTGVLAGHPRRGDVASWLVELEDDNVAFARRAAAEAGLAGVEVMKADAGTTDSYRTAVPADIVLACGIFGNITEDDIATTVAALPGLCAPGATVIWTRGRSAPDATGWIRALFGDAGFTELAFGAPEGTLYGVGAHRLTVPPPAFEAGRRLFSFIR
jgi:hypothetical protein